MTDNDFMYCPNIGGFQIKLRKVASIFGLIITLLLIAVINYYNLYMYNYIIFFLSFGTGVTIFETLDKTCVVFTFLKIKNIDSKFEQERNYFKLNLQRKNSLLIIFKGLCFALIITLVSYLIQM